MNESLHTEGPEDAKSSESRRRQTLTLVAAVAVLGMSLGVDVQELLAAGPGETPQSDQGKQVPTSRAVDTFAKIPDINSRPPSGGAVGSAIGDAAKRLLRPRGIEGEQPEHSTVEPQTGSGTTEGGTPPPKAP